MGPRFLITCKAPRTRVCVPPSKRITPAPVPLMIATPSIPVSSSSPSGSLKNFPIVICHRCSTTAIKETADPSASSAKPLPAATANETPEKIQGSQEEAVCAYPSPSQAPPHHNSSRPKRPRSSESGGGEKKAKDQFPFMIRLSKKEVEKDLEAMGLEPPQRLKRRPKRLDRKKQIIIEGSHHRNSCLWVAYDQAGHRN
ncbi:hypothetical protein ACLOJK_001296 [Asimina triloba]